MTYVEPTVQKVEFDINMKAAASSCGMSSFSSTPDCAF